MMWGWGPGGYGYGQGWMTSNGGWLMMVFMFLVLVAIVVVPIALLRRDRYVQDTPVRRPSDGLAILEERYAKGEISREEYLEKKRDLAA